MPLYASVNIIGSDNGLSPVRRQAINWTNAGLLSIPENKFQWNSNQNYIISIQENAYENVVCQIGGHFVQGDELDIHALT